MKYENWISYRYLVASKGRFLTFLNVISIAGVAIGVASLIVVIGVMTGFGNNLREKIIGSSPHVMVEKETGIYQFGDLLPQIENIEGVKATSAYIQGNIFLEESGQAMGLAIRGIDPAKENNVTEIDKYLVQGSLKDLKENTVMIGSELARYFGYEVGDKITLISPNSGLAGEGWRYDVSIIGVFNTGMADLDMNLTLVNLETAQMIFGVPPSMATGIGVKLDDPYLATEMKEKIYEVLSYNFIIKTWIDNNRNLFEALFLEKWGLFIILSLMVLIASFNIISTLIVTVTSKVHDIGILQSIGVPQKAIQRIFTKQGVFIGFLGIAWGLIGGFASSYLLRTYVKVPKEIYAIDRVPIEIQLSDVLAIVFAAMIISYLATIYPASQAAKLQPVEALRYE